MSMLKRLRFLFIAFFSSAIAGCATDAQRHAATMRASWIAIGKAAASCQAAVNADPKFTPLWAHIPKPLASPTMAQLADASYATPSDIILEEAHHDALLPCRDNAIAQLEGVDSRVALFFSKVYNDGDSIILALVQNKITWGEANRETQQLTVAAREQLRSIGSQIDSELAEQNAAELAHRAQVAQAIGQALNAAAQAAEAAQAARPIVTTCNGAYNYATCVTRQ